MDECWNKNVYYYIIVGLELWEDKRLTAVEDQDLIPFCDEYEHTICDFRLTSGYLHLAY